MSKRSDFERKPRDFYPTPYEAVIPLLKHLEPGTRFIEPCAGDGALVTHLEVNGHKCLYACDIDPASPFMGAFPIYVGDAAALSSFQMGIGWPVCITNPPWKWDMLTPILNNLAHQSPTWLLLWGDLPYTKRFGPYLKWCSDIVAVGRVKWIPGSKHTSTESVAWFRFDASHKGPTVFHGR